MDKNSLKCQIWSIWKSKACGQTVFPDKSILKTKIGENAKIQNLNFDILSGQKLMKLPKMVNFGEFWRTESLKSNSANSNETFWMIFKHCVSRFYVSNVFSWIFPTFVIRRHDVTIWLLISFQRQHNTKKKSMLRDDDAYLCLPFML